MEKNILKIENLSKRYGSALVLNHINFHVDKGEFITLLGPSGCGKTTTLRLIAGLEEAESGSILLSDEDITQLPAEKRKVNTVFQNYALFPHMDVFNNIAYGLKIKNMSKSEIKKKVFHILEQIQMKGYEKRMPSQLSGGQKQRIAIARALINEPQILLLDEPLGALDLKLRQHMQTELKSIQKEFNITFIYVTHDQDEALNMSDRLIIMNSGSIMQTGTPNEIYNKPLNRFAAEFVGDRNIFAAEFEDISDNVISLNYKGIKVPASNPHNLKEYKNTALAIHADKVNVALEKPSGFSIPAVVINKHYTGSQTKLELKLANGEILKKTDYNNSGDFHIGDKLYAHWDSRDCIMVWDGDAD